MIWEKTGEADKSMHVSKQHQNHGGNKGWLVCCHHNLLQTELPAHENLIESILNTFGLLSPAFSKEKACTGWGILVGWMVCTNKNQKQ